MLERINLVPQPGLSSRIRNTVPWTIGTLVIFGCAIVLLAGFRLDREHQRLTREIVLLEKKQHLHQEQQQLMAETAAGIKDLEARELGLRKIVANLQQVPMQKHRFAELLVDVAKVLPQTIRCEKIIIKEKGGQISGTAEGYDELPPFVNKLSQTGRFRSVSLNLLNQGGEKNELSFSINFSL